MPPRKPVPQDPVTQYFISESLNRMARQEQMVRNSAIDFRWFLMPKLIIPNIPNHYEGSGFEVDVTATQIIVRSKTESTQTRERKQEEKASSEKKSPFGPIITRLLYGK
jgi:hypothetical protein